MPSRTMTTTVTVPVGGSPYHPIEQRTTTTTTVTRSVRGPRLRLFATGLVQLTFGGLCLIPVLLLLPASPVTISCCACLAFTGMIGLLSACVVDSKARPAVAYDPNSGTHRVTVDRPIFPHFYMFLVVAGFCLGVASAVQGIIAMSQGGDILLYVRVSVAIGIGIFLALNQMLMICLISPMVRATTTSTEQVTTHPVIIGPPVSSAYQAVHVGPQLAPVSQGHGGGTNSPIYPYIDEPVKENPPTYHEATRYDQARPSAPPEKM